MVVDRQGARRERQAESFELDVVVEVVGRCAELWHAVVAGARSAVRRGRWYGCGAGSGVRAAVGPRAIAGLGVEVSVVTKFPWVGFAWVALSPPCSVDVVVDATMESLARESPIAQLRSVPAALAGFPLGSAGGGVGAVGGAFWCAVGWGRTWCGSGWLGVSRWSARGGGVMGPVWSVMKTISAMAAPVM